MDINRISNRTIVRLLSVIATFVAALYLAVLLRHTLILIGVSVFLALALNPLVERLTRRMPRKNRTLAVLVVLLLAVLLIVLLLYAVLPPLISQSQAFVRDLPRYLFRLEHSDSWGARLLLHTGLLEKIKANPGQVLQSALFNNGISVIRVARGFFNGLVAAVTLFALTLFMMVEGPDWLARLRGFQKPHQREHVSELSAQMYQVITKYVTINLLFALLAAILVGGLLVLFGVPYAVPLAVVAGVLELVPLIGPIIGAVIVILVCLLNSSLNAAIGMGLFFLIYQHGKGNFIHPLVLGKTIDLSPLLILVSVIMGASLAGIVGALVAVPIGGCIHILIKDYFQKHPLDI